MKIIISMKHKDIVSQRLQAFSQTRFDVDSPNYITLTNQLWTIHTHGKSCLMYHQNLINEIRLASP